MAVTIDGVGEINGVVLPTTSFGKVLQVVRATDTTDRSTTSTSFIDTGLSVTITPQKSTSAILLISALNLDAVWNTGQEQYGRVRITDNSGNPISGAQAQPMGTFNMVFGAPAAHVNQLVLIGYATPATTSATTYKVQYRTQNANTTFGIKNADNTGQMYAIEVSA